MPRLLFRSISALSFITVAVAAQASVIVQVIPFFYDNTGGADQTTILNKFDPTLGKLTKITIDWANYATASNQVTNIDAASGTFSNSAFSESDFLVAEDTFSYGLFDQNIVSDNHNGVSLAPGESDLVSVASLYTASAYTSNPGALAAFSGVGTVIAYQASFGIAGGAGDVQVANQGMEEAASVGTLTYHYTTLPAPAAAGTMLIGLLGGFVRRRKSA